MAALSQLLLPSANDAADITLAWDAPASPGIKGYKLYYGPYEKGKIHFYDYMINVGYVLKYTLKGLAPGNYVTVVTAYSDTHESNYSEILNLTVSADGKVTWNKNQPSFKGSLIRNVKCEQ